MPLTLTLALGADTEAAADAGTGTDADTVRIACAALHVATDWGYLDADAMVAIDAALDRICAITWTLARR